MDGNGVAMEFKDLSPEQLEKAKACKPPRI